MEDSLRKDEYFSFMHNLTEEIKDLRYKTFVLEQGIAYNDEFEGDEDSCIHCCLFLENVLIATARVGIEGDFARISRIAVKKEYRQQGKGTAIVRYAEKKAKELNKRSILIIAQVQARGFYEKLGYKAFGETFIDAGLPHLKMKKPL